MGEFPFMKRILSLIVPIFKAQTHVNLKSPAIMLKTMLSRYSMRLADIKY